MLKVDLYNEDDEVPYVRGVLLDQVFGDDCAEECADARRHLANGVEFITGGGAAPLVRIRVAQ